MSLRHGHALPPRQGRLDRLFTFTRVELASARLASLAIGVRPDEARSGDKRDRVGDEGEDEEAARELLVEAEAALRGVEAVPTERLRALSSQIYAVLERGLVSPRLQRALQSAAARLQAVEVARDADATQMPGLEGEDGEEEEGGEEEGRSAQTHRSVRPLDAY